MLKKRIPTIIGLILLIIGAISGVVFINQGTDFMPRAAPEYVPQKVKITNLSENGFVVSWITQEPTIGFIKFGETAGNLATTATDDRDQLAGASGEYRTHYISVQNLRPATSYYFKLGSQKNQLYDNNGQAFSITTPNILGTPPPADTAYGTVVTPANTPAEGVIVYLSLENATPISALVKQNGNWAANLSTARTLSLSQYASYDSETARIDILAQPGTGEPGQAVTVTANHQPVPTITLGQTHDFTNGITAKTESPDSTPQASTTPQTSATPAPSPTGAATPLPDSQFSLNSLDASLGNDSTITITTLPKEDTIITATQPEIKGKAPAGSSLTITVHSPTPYTGIAQVDATGKWTWTPPSDLEPGDHTITVSYTDDEGVLHKLTRHFIVNASTLDLNALSPSYAATPSASATPTPSATPRPSATPTPSATPRTTVATDSAEIVAGTSGPTIFILLMGALTIAAGLSTFRRKSI